MTELTQKEYLSYIPDDLLEFSEDLLVGQIDPNPSPERVQDWLCDTFKDWFGVIDALKPFKSTREIKTILSNMHEKDSARAEKQSKRCIELRKESGMSYDQIHNILEKEGWYDK